MNTITSKLTNNTIESIPVSALALQCHISPDDLDENTEFELKSYLQTAQNFLEEKYNVVFGDNEFQSVYMLKNSSKVYLPKYPINEIQVPSNIELIKGDSTSIILFSNNITDENYIIKYNAGWSKIEDIPAEVKQSLKMLVSFYYNNRDAQQEKQLYSPAFAIEALMNKYNSQII